jgi:hypothetical protein
VDGMIIFFTHLELMGYEQGYQQLINRKKAGNVNKYTDIRQTAAGTSKAK